MSTQGEKTGTESTLEHGDGTLPETNASLSNKDDHNITQADPVKNKVDLKGNGSIHSVHSQSSEVKDHDGNGSTDSIPSQSSGNCTLFTEDLARKRAEAKAAKAKIQYAIKELELRKKQAEIEAELEVLNLQREAEEAEAECQMLESTMGCMSPISAVVKETKPPLTQGTTSHVDIQASPVIHMNPYAQPYIPHQQTSPQVAGVTRFLLRKDLLFSRLSSFNDKPESYCAWKSSFLSVVNELQIMASEQMDLLIKYLGPESRKHALSIKTSNIFDLSKGLQRLWDRLDERYGAPELVEASIRAKLSNFPKLGNKDDEKLYELSDILMELQFLKEDPKYSCMLSYLDSSVGIRTIITKLPYSIQEKWTNRAVKYKNTHGAIFPPFNIFVDFIKEMSRIRNDPSFKYHSDSNPQPLTAFKGKVSTKKTTVTKQNETANSQDHKDDGCVIHKGPGVKHSVANCRVFKSKSLEERRRLMREHGLCFRCCSGTHRKVDCKANIKCKDCRSESHITALHVDSASASSGSVEKQKRAPVHDGEEPPKQPLIPSEHVTTVNSSCTEISGEFKGKSCARIVPATVTYYRKAVSLYAMLDDQSNKFLAKKELFDLLGINSQTIQYLMTSCSGQVMTSGRTASGLFIESADRHTRLQLPCVLECDEIPNNYLEIPTPEVAVHYSHMRDIASSFSPVDTSKKIMLLIGRDLPQAHHVIEQRIGQEEEPFAQRSPLGWTIIGDTCLSGKHIPKVATVYKTFIIENGRRTILEPCDQIISVKDQFLKNDLAKTHFDADRDEALFQRTRNDNKFGTSVEDRIFTNIVKEELVIGPDGKWVAPLPFRQPRQPLPNNYELALRRAKGLDASLKKNPVKRDHFTTFMLKLFDNDHAEKAPQLQPNQERWYLPLFGVYHPQKPYQIRGVFDSSAKYEGTSLNDQLLSGPNLTNNLLGVLIRFRREMIGVVADVQHMFHSFTVKEEHRDFLRFLWYKDSEVGSKLIEYRMKVRFRE